HLDFIRASEEEAEARSSAQRKQLEAMAAAQAERETALHQAEEAQRKRATMARIRNIALVAVTILALLAGLLGLRSEQQRKVAEEYLQEMQITKSRSLVSTAEQNKMDQSTRILLALAALQDVNEKIERLVAPRALESLTLGLNDLRELAVFGGHADAVFAVAVTPDGGRIVTGSKDKTARVWDAGTGAELLQLKGHTDAVFAVAVTPDRSRIITGSSDKTAHVWDAGTGAELL